MKPKPLLAETVELTPVPEPKMRFPLSVAAACVWGLVRYTRTSPRFAIKNVEVVGATHRSQDDLARDGVRYLRGLLS